jgi:hypothetical protein
MVFDFNVTAGVTGELAASPRPKGVKKRIGLHLEFELEYSYS